jgi:hypothetical protein
MKRMAFVGSVALACLFTESVQAAAQWLQVGPQIYRVFSRSADGFVLGRDGAFYLYQPLSQVFRPLLSHELSPHLLTPTPGGEHPPWSDPNQRLFQPGQPSPFPGPRWLEQSQGLGRLPGSLGPQRYFSDAHFIQRLHTELGALGLPVQRTVDALAVRAPTPADLVEFLARIRHPLFASIATIRILVTFPQTVAPVGVVGVLTCPEQKTSSCPVVNRSDRSLGERSLISSGNSDARSATASSASMSARRCSSSSAAEIPRTSTAALRFSQISLSSVVENESSNRPLPVPCGDTNKHYTRS